MFNLAGSANVSVFSGMAGLADTVTLKPGVLLMVLAAWSALPLALAAFAFSRREV
jgi:Cu-processing system permease protein